MRAEAFLISKLERNLKSHLRPFYESKLSQRTSLAWKDAWLLRSVQWLHSPDKADRICSLCLRSWIWVTPFTLTKRLWDALQTPGTVLRTLDSREDNTEQETDNKVLYFSIFIQQYQNLALLMLYNYIRKCASMKNINQPNKFTPQRWICCP